VVEQQPFEVDMQLLAQQRPGLVLTQVRQHPKLQRFYHSSMIQGCCDATSDGVQQQPL
jgi:hypothetical protein